MKILPLFVDSRPAYTRGPGPHSLLLAPLGAATVAGHLEYRFRSLGQPPAVITTFAPPDGYEEALREACPGVEGILPAARLAGHIQAQEPSDALLLLDPRCFPADGFEADALFKYALDPRWIRHLVSLQANEGGTRECVHVDAEGQVRRIQRYYDGVTWPYTSGVASSFVPVACATSMRNVAFASLSELRLAFAAQGLPSRDLPIAGAMYDLASETGLLALNERFALELMGQGAGGSPVVSVGRGVSVHATARLSGPVILHDRAVVGRDALVLGPAVLGRGARVGDGATVAQCVLGPGTTIPPGASLRHRAVFEGADIVRGDEPYSGVLEIDEGTLASQDGERVRGSAYDRVKRVGEAAIAVFALLLLSPLLLLIAVAVRLDSRGPIFYGDLREARGGRPFRCLKFRTMVPDANARQRALAKENALDGPQFKLDHDPRVTRVGRLLRAVSLDELPQLVNVALGQMSLVGPRPSPFRENQLCIPWRDARLAVRPGITGLWQVCRHNRSGGDFHQWIYYDMLYVRHRSLWVDLKIVAATVVTLGGKGHVPLSWILPEKRIGQLA